MTVNELKEKTAIEKSKVVVVKKKECGDYTIYTQVVDVMHMNLLIIGECYAIVFED